MLMNVIYVVVFTSNKLLKKDNLHNKVTLRLINIVYEVRSVYS